VNWQTTVVQALDCFAEHVFPVTAGWFSSILLSNLITALFLSSFQDRCKPVDLTGYAMITLFTGFISLFIVSRSWSVFHLCRVNPGVMILS